MSEQLYQKAWQRLLKEIQKKTGWGNVELQKLMLNCLVNPEPTKQEEDFGLLRRSGKGG